MSSEVMKTNRGQLRVCMKKMLAELTDAQRDVFRRMYDPKGRFANPVDGVRDEQMDWAFQQIERTPKKAP